MKPVIRRKNLVLLILLIACMPAYSEGADAAAPSFRSGDAAAAPSPAAAPRQGSMSLVTSVVLGAVEGITEYLPVSSTGHLLLAEKLLGMWRNATEKSAAEAYAICIQLGAILAVFIISFGRIRRMVLGLFGRDAGGLRLLGNMVIAFIPAAVAGLLLEDRIKGYLFTMPAVAAAWAVGGLFILIFLRKPGSQGGKTLEEMGWDTALIIGLAQCFALWPGVSRSLCTMGAGILLGLSVPAAVEFSFLLGLLTLGAATIYEAISKGRDIITAFGWVSPAVGMVVAGVTAFIAVRWMISYLTRRSPAVFGWYRLVIAAAAAVLLAAGVL
jgi:undecaprenyl-diphosphatase